MYPHGETVRRNGYKTFLKIPSKKNTSQNTFQKKRYIYIGEKRKIKILSEKKIKKYKKKRLDKKSSL